SSALHPWGGRSAPPPRVTFSPMRKSPKNLPEGKAPLGTPLRGTLRSPCGSRTPSIGFQTQQKTDLPLWFCEQIGLVFSFGFFGETFPAVNPWHGRCVALRMLEGLSYRNQNR